MLTSLPKISARFTQLFLSFAVTPIVKISFDAIGDVALIGKEAVAVNGRDNGKRLLRTYSLSTGRKLSSTELAKRKLSSAELTNEGWGIAHVVWENKSVLALAIW